MFDRRRPWQVIAANPFAIVLAVFLGFAAVHDARAEGSRELEAVEADLAGLPATPAGLDPRQLAALRSRIDRHASQAPALAVRLYNRLGTRLVLVRRWREAEDAFRSGATAGQANGTPSTDRIFAHIGVSRMAVMRDDCDAATHEAARALALQSRASEFTGALRDATVRSLSSMMGKCAETHDLEKTAAPMMAQERQTP